MADLTVTADKISLLFINNAEAYNAICGTTITAGQAVYFDTSTGKLALSDASVAGTAVVHGIALEGGAAGQTISILKRGHIGGVTTTGDYGSTVYLSDTAGALADAAGAVSLAVGIVAPLTSDLSKVVYIDAPDWAS